MRFIKLALISFILFFLLFTLISLLFPSQIRISKAINVGAGKYDIRNVIIDTVQWKRWHPMFKNSSEQSMQNIAVTPVSQNDSLIVKKTSGRSGRTVTNGWQIYTHQGTDSLTLQWYMDFNLQWYPWQKFGSLFYEATYGSMMQQGLADIKTIVETKENEVREP